MRKLLFALFLCSISLAALAQQGVGPQRKVWMGPSLGERFANTGCTVTGTSPQTCNGAWGRVTTGTLTTAAATAATYTINNNAVADSSASILCNFTAYSGTVTTNGQPVILYCTPAAGSITVTFLNAHATNALNGTLTIDFQVTH